MPSKAGKNGERGLTLPSIYEENKKGYRNQLVTVAFFLSNSHTLLLALLKNLLDCVPAPYSGSLGTEDAGDCGCSVVANNR